MLLVSWEAKRSKAWLKNKSITWHHFHHNQTANSKTEKQIYVMICQKQSWYLFPETWIRRKTNENHLIGKFQRFPCCLLVQKQLQTNAWPQSELWWVWERANQYTVESCTISNHGWGKTDSTENTAARFVAARRYQRNEPPSCEVKTQLIRHKATETLISWCWQKT